MIMQCSTIPPGLGSPEGVAVDWVGRNMYWTDSGLDRVEVANLDGTNRKTLFDANLVNPRAIVVDPGKGWVVHYSSGCVRLRLKLV